jgi:hypothetical protein
MRQNTAAQRAIRLLLTGGLWLLGTGIAPITNADSPNDFLKLYSEQCQHESGAFQGFDPSRGQMLYMKQQSSEWNCASCHTEDPKVAGEHCETHKKIQPISPVANPDRFTDTAKVEKWFKRSCKDVFGRECTAQEKGDFIAYLLSVK